MIPWRWGVADATVFLIMVALGATIHGFWYDTNQRML